MKTAAVLVVMLAACGPTHPSRSAGQDAAISDSVRAFLRTVARDVTADGPAAWHREFSDSANFFMASEGQLVFGSGEAAGRGIEGLTHLITHLTLTWGDSIRVDPLGPGLAVVGAPYHEVRTDPAGHLLDESGYLTGVVQHQGATWRFRDAHWSVVAPPPIVR